MLSEEKLDKMSRLFKLIADPTRIKILFVLEKGPLRVNQLSERLEMKQSTVSHQLRILKDNNLVKVLKQGREMIYSLTDNHVHTIFNQAEAHVIECIF